MPGLARSTYIRNPAGIAKAAAKLRAYNQRLAENPDMPRDLAWQDDLPELPDDDATVAIFRTLPNRPKTRKKKR